MLQMVSVSRVSKFGTENSQFHCSRLELGSMISVNTDFLDDTWICDIDGCNHRIWNAQAPASKSMIRHHLLSHHADKSLELDSPQHEVRDPRKGLVHSSDQASVVLLQRQRNHGVLRRY